MSKFSPLFTLSLATSLLMIGVGMIVAVLPQRVFATTGSLESVGLIASVFALAYLLAQIPIGILSDRFGAKKFLIIGYLLCGVAGLVFSGSESAGVIYAGRAIQGLGEAPIWALGPALLALNYPSAKGRAIGIYNAAIHAGLTAGPLLGLAITPSADSSEPFLIFAFLCFFSAGFVLLFLRRTPRITGAGPKASLPLFLAILRQKRVALILIGIVLYGTGYGVFVSVLPVSLASSHGFTASEIAGFFVVFYGLVSLAQIVAGPLSDRFGRQRFLIWGMTAASLGLASFWAFSGFWAMLPLGLTSAGLGVFCVASIAALSDAAPDSLKATISGGYYLFWAAGYALGPLIIGALSMRLPMLGYLGMAGVFALYAGWIWLARLSSSPLD